MTRFGDLLRVLASAEVGFIVVGGVAAAAHGASRSTQDVYVVYRRHRKNLERLAGALVPHRPYLRGVPEGLPFRLDAQTLQAGLNFRGGGRYEDLLPHSISPAVFGAECRVLDLQTLIGTKDFEGLAELEILRERLTSRGKGGTPERTD